MATPSRLTRTPPRKPPREVEVAYGMRVAAAWSWRALALGAAIYVLARGLSFFSEILITVLVALLLAALLLPVVDLLDRRARFPRILATLVVLLAFIAALVGLVTLVTSQIVNGSADLVDQVNTGIGQIEDWVTSGPLQLSADQISGYTTQIQDSISSNTSSIVASAVTVTSAATSVVTGVFLTVFLLIFFLHDGRGIWEWCVRLMPRAAQAPLDGALHRGWITLVHYVRATVVVAFVDALGIGIGAAVLGVPLAGPLAVLVFLGAFVPIVGALVSGSVAVLVALVANGPTTALILLVIVLAVQQLESHVLQPLLLGRAVSVHPVAVILAITAGITLAGIPGALFAVPFVAVLNTVVGYLARGGDGTPLPEEDDDDPVVPDPSPLHPAVDADGTSDGTPGGTAHGASDGAPAPVALGPATTARTPRGATAAPPAEGPAAGPTG